MTHLNDYFIPHQGRDSLVSIITPCYNSDKYLSDTIDSVIRQTYPHWEWIIVDDASSDQSTNIIESFNDSRICLIKNAQNQGAAVARNIAIRQAKGRYIAFLDSDDLWYDDFLDITLRFMQTHECELVYTSYARVDEALNPLLKDFIALDSINYKRLLYNCPISMLTSIYDTHRIGKALIPESVPKREDHAMWLNVLQKIPMARAITTVHAKYRIRENSYSRNKWDIMLKQYNVYRSYLKLSIFESLYYTFHWVINGLKKYAKFT